MVDRRVAQTLKDERRLLNDSIEGVVTQAVFVERHVQQPLLAVRVVEERQGAAALPLLDALWRQQMMSRLGEHDRPREQHHAIDPPRELLRRENPERAAEAGSDPRDWSIGQGWTQPIDHSPPRQPP